MWDLIVSVPDHCLSFYSVGTIMSYMQDFTSLLIAVVSITFRLTYILWEF